VAVEGGHDYLTQYFTQLQPDGVAYFSDNPESYRANAHKMLSETNGNWLRYHTARDVLYGTGAPIMVKQADAMVVAEQEYWNSPEGQQIQNAQQHAQVELIRAGLYPADLLIGGSRIVQGRGDLRDYLSVLAAAPVGKMASLVGRQIFKTEIGGAAVFGLSHLQAPRTIAVAGALQTATRIEPAGALAVRSVVEGGSIRVGARGVNGLRQSPLTILDDAQIGSLTDEFVRLGGDPSKLRFNTGRQTGYIDQLDVFNIRGDVLPLDGAIHPRSSMSTRSVLGHELGHQRYSGTRVPIGAWNDEFRASYWAARNAPGLSQVERADLIRDAMLRASEANVAIKPNVHMKRILYGY